VFKYKAILQRKSSEFHQDINPALPDSTRTKSLKKIVKNMRFQWRWFEEENKVDDDVQSDEGETLDE